MLEESRMDKKSLNRLSLPQSRASAVDCKKGTELTHKPWPRSKKREGSGTASKNEPFRRNQPPQRGRGQIDKRSRVHGANYIVGGTQNTGIGADEEPEIGSVYLPGSKKQNLNHLLNFMYPSRGGADRRGPVPRRPVQNLAYKHQHDLYLRANCQFVVKNGEDFKMNLMDPDTPIKWEQVEQIIVRSTGRSECPICLGNPVAGRVGHCGHVYCWACVLHYVAAHEKHPPPCPVCAAPMDVTDMKSAYMIQWASPADEVTMRLVRRIRGTTTVEVAPPRGQISVDLSTPILPLEQLANAPFTKYFTATKDQVFEILQKEREEIENQILQEIDTTEILYLEQALHLLIKKGEEIKNQIDKPKTPEPIEDIPPIVYEKQEVNDKKLDWFDVTEDGAACIELIEENMAGLDINVPEPNLTSEVTTYLEDELNDNNHAEEFPLIDCGPPQDNQVDNVITDIDKENQSKYFYFYQADDGQQIFLNSINIRILNASWGGLVAAPPIIKGRVLHRETLSLADQTRKHMPYTAHLPVYCSFDIVELDLQPPFVTTAALQNFSDELRRRARVRANVERKERRREQQCRRALEGPPRPDLSSEVHFPRASTSFGSPPVVDRTSFSSTEPGEPSTSGAAEQASPSPSTSSGLSFAKMASTSGTWRVRKTAPTVPPPPEAEEGAGPRALVLSDAIEAALHAAPAPSPSPSKKKSKKSKPKVLFATGMQRTG
ncbi:RING finger protein 10 [Papilio machaon]|uniref:RING finger protein 10 n=1 Tax=Papilio machaon TaxID=76193 RepID=UPI001E665291|nr:RING finger protein 10 [Papilio machaon]